MSAAPQLAAAAENSDFSAPIVVEEPEFTAAAENLVFSAPAGLAPDALESGSSPASKEHGQSEAQKFVDVVDRMFSSIRGFVVTTPAPPRTLVKC